MRLCGLLTILVGLLLAPQRDIERPFPTKRHTRLLEYEREVVDMAIIRWISQDGNWAAGGSWSTGSVPGATDTAQFDGTSQVSVTSGHTSGVTNILNLITLEAYRGDIGANGSPLTTNVLNRMTLRGSGTVYYEDTTGSGGDPLITVESPNTVLALHFTHDNDGLPYITVKAGRVQVAESRSGIFQVIPTGSVPAILESVKAGGTRVTELTNAGGLILGPWRDLALAVGSRIILRGGTTAMTDLDADQSGTLVVMLGGTFVIGPNPTTGQSVKVFKIYGGVADFSQLTNLFTIRTLEIYGGEIIRSDWLTVTNEWDFRPDYPDF